MRQQKKTFRSRKQKRKEERKAKKERKKAYFLQKYSKIHQPEHFSKHNQANKSEAVQKPESGKKSDKKSNSKGKLSVESKSTTVQQPKQKHTSKPKPDIKRKILITENKKEDRIIRALEKKMKLNRRKKKSLPQSFVNDGLDYILEVLDKSQETLVEEENASLAVKTKSKRLLHSVTSDSSDVDDQSGENDDSSSESGEENDDLHEEVDDISGSMDIEDVTDKDTENNDDDSAIQKEEDDYEEKMEEEDKEEEDDEVVDNEESAEKEVQDNQNEDEAEESSKHQISLKKDQQKGVTLINKPSGSFIGISATVTPLKRQLKGLFNRLSDANLHFVSNQIEELYMKNPRNDVNKVLTNVMMDSLLSPSLVPERLLMEQAVLLALLHGNIGTEIGAYFLETLVIKLDSLLQEKGKVSDDKECTNIILFLSYMYAFKVTHSILIFDVLHRLINSLSSENELNMIVALLRTVGFNLRKDDSTSLREAILQLQSKVSSVSELCDQSRVQFLLDIVKSIQNNNMHKVPNYDPTIITRLQKVLHGLLRKGHYVQELRISLADLLDSNRKGRWWIVGSAWTESATLHSKNSSAGEEQEALLTSDENFSAKVLELARKQRMNSDVRKKIFCIIMSAEDFMDAFEKLARLGVKLHRDVIHVCIDCCLQEKSFNPFYAHLLQKLSTNDRHYQMALKFALWDKFKDLKTLKSTQTVNISRLLVHLFSTNALPITILKAFHFSEMDKALVHFLRHLFIHLFTATSEEVCHAVFQRLAMPSPKLRLLQEGLKLFLQHFLLRSREVLPEDSKKLISDRVKMVENLLTVSDHKMF